MLIPKKTITGCYQSLYTNESLPNVVYAHIQDKQYFAHNDDMELYTDVSDLNLSAGVNLVAFALLPTMYFLDDDTPYLTYIAQPFELVKCYLTEWYKLVNDVASPIRIVYTPVH